MGQYTVRRFEEKDAQAVSNLIEQTSRVVLSKVYEPGYIDNLVEWVAPEKIIERAGWTHFYVICDGEKIISSGAIGPRDGLEDESELFNIYILPEYQGKGIGRLLIETLEKDEYFLRAKRVFIHAALSAIKFYQRLGYDHVNGEMIIDEEHGYRLEKLREI
ncbi:MAG: GNAT family N-acetyltransferase [Oscillospiraceae bacterium]|nr:GNAT family N-acetyltransferase [Oscillospiraceae bacterium]